MKFSPLIKEQVIKIGFSGNVSNISELKNLIKYEPEPFYYWGDNFMTINLNNEDLIYYFKGLVIIEKELGSCGSTTPAARVYWEIENRKLDPDYSLADWAFQYSDNEYIPFGFIRHGERTAYEYIQWREDFHRRLIKEKLDKAERKKLQLERAKNIAEEKRKKDLNNRAYYQRLMTLPTDVQVETIISDNKHIFYYYMPVIFQLLERNDIAKEDLEKLIFRVGEMKPTPFSKKIAKLIQKKIITMYFSKRYNTPETLEKLSKIEAEVNRKVDKILKDEPRMLGFCHLYWATKKGILKEEYGIDWLTPAECNPGVMYD